MARLLGQGRHPGPTTFLAEEPRAPRGVESRRRLERIPARATSVKPRQPASQAHRPERKIAERSEEHTSELQSPCNLVCRLLLEKKKKAQAPHNGQTTLDDPRC